ncbi:MAG: hypothetical protein LBU27_04120 [Candidatus Peribacteria bacterium]|jgi:hypothetical protein|nr:hypothetical protein [Candidatus Peribacteria bacterium]
MGGNWTDNKCNIPAKAAIEGTYVKWLGIDTCMENSTIGGQCTLKKGTADSTQENEVSNDDYSSQECVALREAQVAQVSDTVSNAVCSDAFVSGLQTQLDKLNSDEKSAIQSVATLTQEVEA